MDRDACGIGFVANARGRVGRDIVELALLAVSRMTHRGGIAADGDTGDGAGILMPIPRGFLADVLAIEADPSTIGTLIAFAPRRRSSEAIHDLVARAATEEALSICGWRHVPVDPTALGRRAESTRPQILQAIMRRPELMPPWEAERRAQRLRRRIEHRQRGESDPTYVVTSSFTTVTYKALVRADRLVDFYPDLADPRLRAGFAIFHQRFATNTTPSWERTQPFRMLCHNGEINTIAGNRLRMRGRQGSLGFEHPSDEQLFNPAIDPDGSDSASLDEVVELLTKEGGPAGEGREIERVMAMLISSVQERDPGLDDQVRGFWRWHAAMSEPWDGPAGVVFTDGRRVGAILDRHGFRPLRMATCEDGLVVCASEAGVIPLEGRGQVQRTRLGGGEIVVVDPGRTTVDLNPLGGLGKGLPSGTWGVHIRERHERPPRSPLIPHLAALQVVHGFTREDVALIIRPSSTGAEEPTFSMGDDTPPPPMGRFRRPVFDALRQRFAQVTNPAIDHVRERHLMSLRVHVGRRAPLLCDDPDAVDLLASPSFLATEVPPGRVLDATWAIAAGVEGFPAALDRLAEDAIVAVREGCTVVTIQQRAVDPTRAPVPTLLAVGVVNKALVVAGVRDRASIVVEADDVRHSHDVACLLAAGAEIVSPRLAAAIVAEIAEERLAPGDDATAGIELALRRHRMAMEGGVLKAMARLGISSVESYRGTEAFDVLGLGADVVGRVFLATPAPLGGRTLENLASDILERHAEGFDVADPTPANPGIVKYRRGGEHHATNPNVVRALHRVVDPELDRLRSTTAGEDPTDPPDIDPDGPSRYERFVQVTASGPATTLRDLLQHASGVTPVPIGSVEPAESILRRFSTGAISQGAIGAEAHEALAIGMRMVGGRSNSGEGGEDPTRFRSSRNCSIKQIASGRFGVTPECLAFADELQIKIAQGSKPGEGGQLPGAKVTREIARLRHTQPGVALISPAPHHDIYSIEDLAQLIYDLRQANEAAEISVKLVAEHGIGVIATGVVKAGADIVHVAGADGGTGASPLISINHVGLPWEMGLVEVHRTLVGAGLRRGVRLRVDGGLRTGADVVTAALLGADEYSFGTAALVALGCLMVRTCHLDTCPAGIATQRPELRERFAGTPEMLATYMRALADDVRSIVASLGFTRVDDLIGRSRLLEPTGMDPPLDLGSLVDPTGVDPTGPPSGSGPRSLGDRTGSSLGDRIHADAWPSLVSGASARLSVAIANTDRAVGARLGVAIAERYGDSPPPGTIHVGFEGTAGQSFGAFLTQGMTFSLDGEANDHVGKGMAGGTIAIRAPAGDAGEPCLVGNAALYGATGGRLFVAGSAGDRFAVRNSGASAVVEGVGDHACEYMTGGLVVIVGPVGRNLAAGMTGGCVMLVRPPADVDERMNPHVQSDAPSEEEMARCRALLEDHVRRTGSERVRSILDRWSPITEARSLRPRAGPA